MITNHLHRKLYSLGQGYDERLPNRPSNQIGCYVCGEQGLIAALEFRTGLKKLKSLRQPGQ